MHWKIRFQCNLTGALVVETVVVVMEVVKVVKAVEVVVEVGDSVAVEKSISRNNHIQ